MATSDGLTDKERQEILERCERVQDREYRLLAEDYNKLVDAYNEIARQNFELEKFVRRIAEDNIHVRFPFFGREVRISQTLAGKLFIWHGEAYRLINKESKIIDT